MPSFRERTPSFLMASFSMLLNYSYPASANSAPYKLPITPAPKIRILIGFTSLTFFASPRFIQPVLLLPALYQMPYRHNRMIKYHPWAGKPHDSTNHLTHIRFVAMNSAIWTKRLCLHKRTVIASGSGIPIQFIALFTHFSLLHIVITAAIEGNHFGNNFLLVFPLRLCINYCSLNSMILPHNLSQLTSL